MAAIPFPTSTAPGDESQEGAGQLINCFAEKTQPGALSPLIFKRTAGLRQILSIADHVHLRGGILVASTLVVALNTRAYAVTVTSGVYSAANLGALSGSDLITVAKNNAATPNIVCVTSAGCFNLFTGSAPTSFADADLPQPNSVSVLHGYFLWTTANGYIWASGLNAVTVASNSFSQDQSLGELLRGVTFRDEFFAFGTKGAAVYRDIGSSPFPLERLPVHIPVGIAGTHAISGWEEGGPGELIWVGNDGLVYQLQDYKSVVISSEDISRTVSAAVRAGSGSLLQASSYKQDRHSIWSLTLPDSWTLEYNLATQSWHERKSFGESDWRASGIVRAFNLWIAGDKDTGLLFSVDPTYAREAGDPLVADLISGVVRPASQKIELDITAGVGMAAGEDPIQTDPSVLISWSQDGGYSFGNPVSRVIGAQGEASTRVTVNRTGRVKAKSRRYRVQFSDPVHFGFMGGQG